MVDAYVSVTGGGVVARYVSVLVASVVGVSVGSSVSSTQEG